MFTPSHSLYRLSSTEYKKRFSIHVKSFILATFALGCSLLSAQNEADNTLLVGIKETPPFTMKAEDGSWMGPTVWLMDQISLEMGVKTQFKEMSLPEIFSSLENGSIDAGVAALSITADREKIIDFTHSYFETGIGIATRRENPDMWLLAVRNLFSLAFLKGVGSLLLVLIIVGILVWLAERKVNEDQFGGKPAKGIGSGLWWSAVTMTTVGYGDKAPMTLAGRVIGLIWMFTAIIIISGFTAGFASSLTRDSISKTVSGAQDLAKVQTATVTGSTSAAWLSQLQIPFRTAENLEVLLKELNEGKWGAVVFDKPVLDYIVAKNDLMDVEVLEPLYSRENYGIALAPNSPHQKQMNLLLLELTETESWSGQLNSIYQK